MMFMVELSWAQQQATFYSINPWDLIKCWFCCFVFILESEVSHAKKRGSELSCKSIQVISRTSRGPRRRTSGWAGNKFLCCSALCNEKSLPLEAIKVHLMLGESMKHWSRRSSPIKQNAINCRKFKWIRIRLCTWEFLYSPSGPCWR